MTGCAQRRAPPRLCAGRISSGATVKLTPSIRLFGLLLLALALSGAVVAFSERTHRRLGEANQQIASSTEAQGIVSELLALVIDAETAQRGFLMTERHEYLDPYVVALPQINPKLGRLRDATAGAPAIRRARGPPGRAHQRALLGAGRLPGAVPRARTEGGAGADAHRFRTPFHGPDPQRGRRHPARAAHRADRASPELEPGRRLLASWAWRSSPG